MMQIRKMQQKDMKRIVEITRSAWNENTLYKLLEDRHGLIGNKGWQERKVGDLEDFCRRRPGDVIVAVEGDKVLGYASFGINTEDAVGNVLNNAVDPGFQGRGVGTAMNKWIIDLFRKERLRIAKVITLQHDKAARRVYEKGGFKELARSVHYSMEL